MTIRDTNKTGNFGGASREKDGYSECVGEPQKTVQENLRGRRRRRLR